jgi:hypothetical protein
MPKLRHGHAPGHIREAFCDAVEAFVDWDGNGPEPTVAFEVNCEPKQITLSEACRLVWNCTDILPSRLVSSLCDLEFKNHTYAAAARAMRAWIAARAIGTGAIAVSVDGRPLFTWDGDDGAIRKVLEEFPRIAENTGMTADALAMNCIAYTRGGGLLENTPAGRQVQMMAVIWYILGRPTNHLEHPGKIADYAGTLSFEVDLHHRAGGCDAVVTAKGPAIDA